jgi:uncharacterized surface anchored protein
MAEKGGVQLTVKDTDGLTLEGAVFGVYNAKSLRISEMITGKNGRALNDLSAGVYYMLEETTPQGYSADSNKYNFYVTTGQTSDVLVLKHKEVPPIYIPKTGEAFPWLNYGMAALCLGSAVISLFGALCPRKRRAV